MAHAYGRRRACRYEVRFPKFPGHANTKATLFQVARGLSVDLCVPCLQCLIFALYTIPEVKLPIDQMTDFD